MGASFGGIAIKFNSEKIELISIAKEFFGENIEKVYASCDTRCNGCVYLGRTEDFLVIINKSLGEQFLESQGIEMVEKYFQYFQKPDFIFAFEEYDNGEIYGYSLIYEGVVKRQFKSVEYQKVLDFGTPEAVEDKWLNAETKIEDIGDGEFVLVYKSPRNGEYYTEMGLPQLILQELMLEKLGFNSWNLDEFIIEEAFFVEQKSSIKKWWKIWE